MTQPCALRLCYRCDLHPCDTAGMRVQASRPDVALQDGAATVSQPGRLPVPLHAQTHSLYTIGTPYYQHELCCRVLQAAGATPTPQERYLNINLTSSCAAAGYKVLSQEAPSNHRSAVPEEQHHSSASVRPQTPCTCGKHYLETGWGAASSTHCSHHLACLPAMLRPLRQAAHGATA